MPNVLIGSNVHWWNAEAAYAKATAKALVDLGYHVWIHTRANTLNESYLSNFPLLNDVDFHSANPYKLALSYQRFLKFIHQNQIDILHPHRSEGFLFYIRAAHLFQIPIVRTRGSAKPIRNNFLNKKLYSKWTDACIFPSQIARSSVLQRLQIPKNQQHVIPYPVSAPQFGTQTNYHSELQLVEDSLVIGIVGRLSKVKGHDLLLPAFQKVLQSLPNTVLLVVYKDFEEDKERLEELKKQSESFGIAQQIRWVGHRKDIREVMKFCDVGVVSSIGSEMICRVAIEFFSVGTPVVTFPTGCLPEVVLDEVNGFCTKSIHIEELAGALTKILQDSDIRKRLSEQALLFSQNQFSEQTFSQSLKAVYHALLK